MESERIPEEWRGDVHWATTVRLTLIERLCVLFSGRIDVWSRVLTEHHPGRVSEAGLRKWVCPPLYRVGRPYRFARLATRALPGQRF